MRIKFYKFCEYTVPFVEGQGSRNQQIAQFFKGYARGKLQRGERLTEREKEVILLASIRGSDK